MVKSAFAKRVGDDADLEDSRRGRILRDQGREDRAPSLPTLAEARPALTKAYVTQLYIEALKAKANELVARIKAARRSNRSPPRSGGHVVRQAGMQRIQAAKYRPWARASSRAFSA